MMTAPTGTIFQVADQQNVTEPNWCMHQEATCHVYRKSSRKLMLNFLTENWSRPAIQHSRQSRRQNTVVVMNQGCDSYVDWLQSRMIPQQVSFHWLLDFGPLRTILILCLLQNLLGWTRSVLILLDTHCEKVIVKCLMLGPLGSGSWQLRKWKILDQKRWDKGLVSAAIFIAWIFGRSLRYLYTSMRLSKIAA